jgi:hypothetical protein
MILEGNRAIRQNECMNLNFGMYVEVKRVGTVQVGDKVYLAE